MHAAEADTARIQALRTSYLRWIRQFDARRLVFIDEAGSHIAMSREYAWAPRGARASDAVPRNRGTVTTIIGALTVDGLTAVMTLEGGTSGDVFAAYVEKVLLPELLPGDLVVMDNLGAHKDVRIRPLIESAGARVVYQPPYSPDLNPIELAWSKLKWWLRMAKARTHEALDTAIAMALEGVITSEDAVAWFRHCGYGAQLM